MKLLGSLASPYVRKVRIVMAEKKLDYAFALEKVWTADSTIQQSNPLGKVPAIVHKGALVTELGAIFIYLADAFPQKGLAPTIGDALRGPYLRWLVFYGSAFEPAIVDRSMKREPARASRSPYGDFDGVMALIDAQLTQGPYLFGERFTAADILWGGALRWTVGFGLVPESAHISAYVERVTSRPSFARVAQTDEELLKIHEAAAAGK